VQKALLVLRENGRYHLDAVGARNPEQAATAARAETIHALCRAFDQRASVSLASVGEATTRLSEAATAMTTAAEHSSARTTATQQASAGINTVAAAAEELTSSIDEIGHQMRRSAAISTDAMDQADKTDAMIAGLAVASQKIGEIVTLISSIASQTNLLALNATIAAAVEEQGAATGEIARNVQEVAQAANEISSSITEVSGAVDKASEVATEVHHAAETMGSEAEIFKDDVAGFLGNIRAA
jgi:methyl-accepting chemotaxis protein